jgi:hypothetical protein
MRYVRIRCAVYTQHCTYCAMSLSTLRATMEKRKRGSLPLRGPPKGASSRCAGKSAMREARRATLCSRYLRSRQGGHSGAHREHGVGSNPRGEAHTVRVAVDIVGNALARLPLGPNWLRST